MTPLADKTQIVRHICAALAAGDTHKASEIARKDYPFAPRSKAETKLYSSAFAATSVVLRDGFIARSDGTRLVAREIGGKRSSFSAFEATSLFLRDGFIDRYTGTQLVFPGALRLLSLLLPVEFPWDRNWEPSVSHIISWDFFPTVDHVVPITRLEVPDSTDNWITTSMMLNNVKASRTLYELGWTILPPGDLATWDGLMRWFLEFISRSPEHLAHSYIKRWHSAAKRACLRSFAPSDPLDGEHGTPVICAGKQSFQDNGVPKQELQHERKASAQPS